MIYLIATLSSRILSVLLSVKAIFSDLTDLSSWLQTNACSTCVEKSYVQSFLAARQYGRRCTNACIVDIFPWQRIFRLLVHCIYRDAGPEFIDKPLVGSFIMTFTRQAWALLGLSGALAHAASYRTVGSSGCAAQMVFVPPYTDTVVFLDKYVVSHVSKMEHTNEA